MSFETIDGPLAFVVLVFLGLMTGCILALVVNLLGGRLRLRFTWGRHETVGIPKEFGMQEENIITGWPIVCPECSKVVDSHDSYADTKADMRDHYAFVHPGRKNLHD